jgi:hypothetical protein
MASVTFEQVAKTFPDGTPRGGGRPRGDGIPDSGNQGQRRSLSRASRIYGDSTHS